MTNLAALLPVMLAAAPYLWQPQPSKEKDYYIAFRGEFELAHGAQVELRTLGASWFVAWLDGEVLTEGPVRFPVAFPEYQSNVMRLAAGRHVLAAQVHHEGVATRLLPEAPPFWHARVLAGGEEVAVRWKSRRLARYTPAVARVNAELGWVEWCDTRKDPAGWQQRDFNDAAWSAPAGANPGIGEMQPPSAAGVRQFIHDLIPLAQGRLAEVYGYERDNISARFFLRDLVCDQLPPQGVWRRYDLGRVRLGRPRITLNLPAGAVVEFAYCEALRHGRVSPWITLSLSDSANLDHYVARGGRQEFFPLTPRGGRFVEVHVLAPPGRVRFLREQYVERGYYGPPDGYFRSGDALLDRIWTTGVETLRACAEDAIIDNPTRERGEWTGDAEVAIENAAVAFSDLRLIRRGLRHAAQCARADGLVAALGPGTPVYFSTYALQWVNAAVRYYELTGDRSVLEELHPYALRNMAAFEAKTTGRGLEDGVAGAFIDWGYVRGPGPVDLAVNLHYLNALRAMARWSGWLGRTAERAKFEGLAARMEGVIRPALPGAGYHTAALALGLGLIEPPRQSECIAQLKRHMLDCFPNNPDAPRLWAPDAASPRLITPYFGTFALPPLIERGEADFVLDQYRKAWGWALGGGRTTWLEVFDERWSHAHQWSGCPTWQLSRYVLGLNARYDLGMRHYVLSLKPGSLPQAEGGLPLPDGAGVIRVRWQRETGGIRYQVETPVPIHIHIGAETVRVERRFERVLNPI